MDNTRMRYRGAQPFSDDTLSQQTFFGRREASESLTNQILANRLVVVYAKSGVGKSSLLNAGVAPRLREAGYQPLLIRLNDIRLGPTASVFEGVKSDAARQHTEYVHGDTGSLWAFFKTVEFWRGDRLLTPVLIIDQFEELFTLHTEAARDTFLSELSHVVRGVRPTALATAHADLGDSAPPIHVVLSLREDFLGILEDGADRIPQIMDHRFRLVPLSRQSAAEAMAGPALLADPALATRPFTLAPEFTEAVLDYLTQRSSGASEVARRYVEPFHLQLICQRIEQVVIAAKTKKAKGPVPAADHAFDLVDFGGEAALSYTLATFYTNAIKSISDAPVRPVAKRLCEEFLISPEGRRLSIEEHELRKQLRLPERALAQLVESRLLRTDRRSDSTYYELSHDALVQPVLATRRTQALLLGWSAMAFGALGVLACGWLILFVVVYLALPTIAKKDGDIVGAVFLIIGATALLLLAQQVWKAGWRAHRRFRRRRLGTIEGPMPVFIRTRDKVLGWTMLVPGIGVVVLFVLASIVATVAVSLIFMDEGKIPSWITPGESPFWNNVYGRPVQEIAWLCITVSTAMLLGTMLLRAGWRRLHPEASLGHALRPAPRRAARWRFVASVLGMTTVAAGIALLEHCANSPQGQLPAWMSQMALSSDFPAACKKSFEGSSTTGVTSLAFFLACLFCVSLPGLLLPLRALYRRLRPSRLAG